MPGKSYIRNLVRVLLVLLGILLVIVGIAQWMAEDAVADFLDRKLPQHVQLEYGDMTVNVLAGSVGLRDISLGFYDSDSMLLNTKVHVDAISLEGMGYWRFAVHDAIDVERLHLERPEVRHYPYRMLPKGENEPQGVVQLLKTIQIGELSVAEGRLDILQAKGDSVAVRVQHVAFTVEDAGTGPEQINQKIPVVYGNYELYADSIYVDLGPYEALNAAAIKWNRARAQVTDLQLNSKYEKLALSAHLRKERDHIDLRVPSMVLDSIRFGFEKDTFFIATGPGRIQQPVLEMFRDKFVADDKSPKKLYGQSIRQLPIHIDIPEIEIIGGEVVYSERVADVEHPGKLYFESLDATLLNLSNTYPKGERTTVMADTKFMGQADMTLEWSFDMNLTDDTFVASGTVHDFDTESINPFLQSNLRAKATGVIDELYFTIDGNVVSSAGQMMMKYEDFKFEVLKKNRLGINKLLTAIGNLFVDDGSKTDAKGYRYGLIEAERESTKSFFSYLWLNVRNGILSTLMGNGEKKSDHKNTSVGALVTQHQKTRAQRKAYRKKRRLENKRNRAKRKKGN